MLLVAALVGSVRRHLQYRATLAAIGDELGRVNDGAGSGAAGCGGPVGVGGIGGRGGESVRGVRWN